VPGKTPFAHGESRPRAKKKVRLYPGNQGSLKLPGGSKSIFMFRGAPLGHEFSERKIGLKGF
jgi:hypothetical protein